MSFTFAAELMGHTVPTGGAAVLIVVIAVGIFFGSRGMGGGGNPERMVGRGQMHRCKRCGVDFQPEKVELLANGDVRHWIDERCPHCGWELDWGSPNKPGGASGRW